MQEQFYRARKKLQDEAPSCLVPVFDGALFSQEWKDALWARFFTGAPERQGRSVERLNCRPVLRANVLTD